MALRVLLEKLEGCSLFGALDSFLEGWRWGYNEIHEVGEGEGKFQLNNRGGVLTLGSGPEIPVGCSQAS